MTTVQLAISDADYLRALRRKLLDDGEHEAVPVDEPGSDVPGLIVAESDLLGDINQVAQPERYIVLVRRDAYFRISQLWQAGFRSVVFKGDPPDRAYLAILSAELRLAVGRRKMGRKPNGGIPAGLKGPFDLTDAGIDVHVEIESPGVYTLGHCPMEGVFQPEYVGRSDQDVANQLHLHVGRYAKFQYEYCSSAQTAFELECTYYHQLNPYDNATHPWPSSGFHWKCPNCGQ